MQISSGTLSRAFGAMVIATAALSGCTTGGSEVVTQSLTSSSSIPSASVPATSAPSASATPSTATAATSDPNSDPPGTGVTEATTPWPADFTPPQQEAAKLSLQVVAGFIAAVDKAEAAPSANDWTAEIRRFSADPLASQALQGIQSMVQYDIHAESAIKYDNLTVVSADDHRVVVSSCMDSTTAAWIDPSGANVLAPPALPRLIKTFVLSAYDAQYAPEGWLVFETDFADPATPC